MFCITSGFSDFLAERMESICNNVWDRSHDDAINCRCDYECAKSQKTLIEEIIQKYKECGGEVDA